MEEIKTGGHAFPTNLGFEHGDEEGMTLRDYFAAKAMQALIVQRGYTTPNEVAYEAFKYADQMLSWRLK